VADDGAKGNDGDALQVSEYRLFVSARLVPLTFAPAIAIVVIWLLSPHSPRNVRIKAWAKTGLVNNWIVCLVLSFRVVVQTVLVFRPWDSGNEMLARGAPGRGDEDRAVAFERLVEREGELGITLALSKDALPSSSASRGIVWPLGFWVSCVEESSSSSSSTSRISSWICEFPPSIASPSCSIFTPKARKSRQAAHSVQTYY
jgi:hypothetical protein